MSSDGNSSGVGSVDGGTGVLFSVLRPRRSGALRAAFFRVAVLRLVVRVVPLRPVAFLRAADFRLVVFRAVVLPVAVFRAAVLRNPVLRPAPLRAADLRTVVLRAADLRAAVLRTTDLRTGVLRAAGLWRTVFRAPVLRGRPGLRLLGMSPLVLLFVDVRRWVSHFSCHANRLRLLPSAVCMREFRGRVRRCARPAPSSIRIGSSRSDQSGRRNVRCAWKTNGLNMTAIPNDKLEIRPLDEKRYALTLDGLVRYIGTQEECERRAEILSLKTDRATQDKALARSVHLLR